MSPTPAWYDMDTDDEDRYVIKPRAALAGPAQVAPCNVVGTIHGVEIHELAPVAPARHDDAQDGAR